jgi:hypothetical protein
MEKRPHFRVAALAACVAAFAAAAMEPAGAHLPGVSRDCGVRADDLKARMQELEHSREALDAEARRLAQVTQSLEGERVRAEAAGAAAVEGYNARMAGHNRRVDLLNERVGALNRESARFNAEGASLASECSRGLRLSGGDEPRLEDDERQVLAAALGDRLRADMNVVLENRTATFLCSRSLPDLVQFEGCSGMRGPAESAEQVMARLKRAWPGVSDTALSDLVAKSERRARIDAPLDVRARQVLRGYGDGVLGEATDAVKVSRVGFDAARREAVLFVAVRTRDRARSYAEYVRLTRSGNTWGVAERMRLR